MQQELVVGGLYSVETGDGRFGVVKVLALEPGIVHIRLYKNKFRSRPASVDPGTLSLGSVFEGEDFGIGHTPLDLEGFMNWQPTLLMNTDVADDELEGYRMWKEATSSGSPGSFSETARSIMRRVIRIVRPNRPN
jgi:hypothetical protein